MKFRAITMGIVQENGRPLQSFSDSMEVIRHWAAEVSKQHKIDVKIYQTYERVLTTVKKPYNKEETKRIDNILYKCTCDTHINCKVHPIN